MEAVDVKKSSLHPPALQLQPMLLLHYRKDRFSPAYLPLWVGWHLEVEQALESGEVVDRVVDPFGQFQDANESAERHRNRLIETRRPFSNRYPAHTEYLRSGRTLASRAAEIRAEL